MVFQSLRECSLIDPGRLNEYYHGKTILIYDAKGNLVDRKFEQFCLYNSLEKIQLIETFIPREERFLLNESIKGYENVTYENVTYENVTYENVTKKQKKNEEVFK